MEMILMVGLLLLLFSILYLIFHFIRKLFKKDKFLSKKLFYSTFLCGVILLVVGSFIYDNSKANLLNEEVAKSTELSQQVTKLKTEIKTLEKKVSTLEKTKKALETKNADLKAKETATLTEKESLSQQITELESKVSTLTKEKQTIATERDKLSEEVASLNSAASSSEESQNSFVDYGSSESEYYGNCTEARAAGAAPVRVGDPGYGRHLDRDGDGVGCE
ncbi:excalibur calcium-binding domain-containing protein [Pseudobacillus wudalianchiensis]|uniref:Excalibur calcium-binding domain-containing protein n=1 Tax=Pseudobacillus wudalianchiensis TaxID=1743143 RepID=A0A1B9ANN6_9BACI|nr:excalibur calcium-binding domain-containing protein [Bacillus wudalianchiensis]OCA85268.1 hypothetical protein A8F95_11395 [Bacillus wudalianchiensis]